MLWSLRVLGTREALALWGQGSGSSCSPWSAGGRGGVWCSWGGGNGIALGSFVVVNLLSSW